VCENEDITLLWNQGCTQKGSGKKRPDIIIKSREITSAY
jgi:hypothetical protein